jgi:hypothetical protein
LISVRTVDPQWGEWLKSSADFNPNHYHVNAASKQTSLPTTSRPHHHATSKQKYCMLNVLVSLQICEIKNQKEWLWPPNIINSVLTLQVSTTKPMIADLVE